MKRVLLTLFLCLFAGQASASEPALDKGEKLNTLGLPATGDIKAQGWTRAGRTTSYRLSVPAGTDIEIAFKASSRFAFIAIFDLEGEDPEEALFSSDSEKLPARIHADKAMDLYIRPYFVKQAARRGLGAHFEMVISRKN